MSENNQQAVNQMLAALPKSEYQRLNPYLEPIYLDQKTVLHEPGEKITEVYFPCRAMISLVSIMIDGSTTEIGLVGNEGMVGLPVILGGNQMISYSVVQISGTAVKLRADILRREFQRGEELQRLLLLYTQAMLTQANQITACNCQHHIQKRLARWLLSVQDCVQSDELLLTQEFISNILGIRRSGVTEAAGKLQKLGIISYSRGRIKILNRHELEAAACECYQLIRSEFARLLDYKKS